MLLSRDPRRHRPTAPSFCRHVTSSGPDPAERRAPVRAGVNDLVRPRFHEFAHRRGHRGGPRACGSPAAPRRTMELVPGTRGSQNIFEAVIEALYDMLEGIVGPHMVGKAFPLLATLFLFILVSNWFGLLPGVGTIGFNPEPRARRALLAAGSGKPAAAPRQRRPQPHARAWRWCSPCSGRSGAYQELGVGGFFSTSLARRARCSGIHEIPADRAIFAFVGVIEVISIAFRPVSLSLRLFRQHLRGRKPHAHHVELGRDDGDALGAFVP